MSRYIDGLALMTRSALPVVESPGNGLLGHRAIALRMRIMARRARHPTVDVAVAVPVRFLVGEGPHAPVGVKGAVAQRGKPQRVEELERVAGEVARVQLILHRVTLEADAERCLLVQRPQ